MSNNQFIDQYITYIEENRISKAEEYLKENYKNIDYGELTTGGLRFVNKNSMQLGIHYYSIITNIIKDDPQPWYIKGKCEYRLHLYDQALDSLKKVEKYANADYSMIDAWYYLAKIYEAERY